MSEALQVQFDPWKYNYFSKIKAELEKSCKEAECELSEGEGYVNLDCCVENKTQLRKLWKTIKSEIGKDEQFAGAIIVTCTDEGSWANYLLLHHRDPSEKGEIDKL